MHGDEAAGLVEGLFEFLAADTDVGDVEAVLGEFGTEDDEAPMSVGGRTVFGALGIETVFPFDKEIAEPSFE